jgi:predicted component of type VI protein secretion system
MNIKLLVKQGRPAGKALHFGPGEYYLGRGEECHVRFNSDWVSRQHCLLAVRSREVVLTDLGSRNGTLLNGQLVQQECALRDGDLVHVGPVVFEVKVEAPADASLPQDPALIQAPGEELTSDISPLSSTAHQPALRPPIPENPSG